MTNDTKHAFKHEVMECQASTFGVDSMKIYFSCVFFSGFQSGYSRFHTSASKALQGKQPQAQKILSSWLKNVKMASHELKNGSQIYKLTVSIQSTCLCHQAVLNFRHSVTEEY